MIRSSLKHDSHEQSIRSNFECAANLLDGKCNAAYSAPGSPASDALELRDGDVVIPCPEVSAAVEVVRDGLDQALPVDVHSAGDGRVVRQVVLVGRDRRRRQLWVTLFVIGHRRGRLGRLYVLMRRRWRRRGLPEPPSEESAKQFNFNRGLQKNWSRCINKRGL